MALEAPCHEMRAVLGAGALYVLACREGVAHGRKQEIAVADPISRLVLESGVNVGFAKVSFTDSGRGMKGRPGRAERFTVHDDLNARAMFVSGVGGSFCLLSLDHACLEKSQVVAIKQRIAGETGLDPRHIVTFCSHTHSDFDYWDEDVLTNRLTQAVCKARDNVRPTEVGYGETDVGTGVNVNRRVILPNGHGAFCIMYNTNCTFEGNRLDCTGSVRGQYEALGADWDQLGIREPIYADGPTDTTLNAIVFREPGGKALGSFVRFSAHACVVSPRHEHIGNVISADYVGYLTGQVERRLGGVCLFGNGPCGNLRVLYRENTFAEAERIGTLLARRALQATDRMSFRPLAQAEIRHKQVSLPVTAAFPQSIEEAERRLAAVKDEIEKGKSENRDVREIKGLYHHQSFLASKLRLLKGGARNEAFLKECLSGWLTRSIHCVLLGDVALAALPGEVFTQIGRRIRDEARRERFFVASLANGFMPYLPCGDEYETGAYEVKESVLEAGADETLVREVLTLCS